MQVGDKAVLGGVGAGDRLGLAVEGAERGDRAEGFLLHDQRVGGDVGEDGRGVEGRTELGAGAAGEEAGAAGEGVGDVGVLLGDRARVDQRADVGIVDAATDGEGGGARGETAGEGVVDRALDQEAVGAEAVLAGGGELGLDGLVDGAVEVGVGEDEERAWPPSSRTRRFTVSAELR